MPLGGGMWIGEGENGDSALEREHSDKKSQRKKERQAGEGRETRIRAADVKGEVEGE